MMQFSLRNRRNLVRAGATSALALCLLGMLGLQSSQATNPYFVPTRELSPYQVDQKDPGKAPKVYTIPIRGQLGTDINSALYKTVIADVKEKKPDLIVFVLNSADINTRDYLEDDDREEMSQFEGEDMRVMVMSLKEELKGIPQVIWVKDAVGFSALLAFAWPEMFMSSKARLYGLRQVELMVAQQTPDYEWFKKLLSAWEAISAGFFEAGDYPKQLALAMIRAEYDLSVSWEGRKLVWRLDDTGTYIVDDNPKSAAGFDSKTAEDLMLTKGTADDLDDLVFLLGYREWDKSLVEGKQDGARLVDDYIKRWRAAYKDSFEDYITYDREMGWASGDEAVMHLGKAKKALTNILDAMNKYPAVEQRWGSRRSPPRLTRLQIDGLLKQIKELIIKEEAKKKQRGGGSGSGGGGRGGKGLGGGGKGLGGG